MAAPQVARRVAAQDSNTRAHLEWLGFIQPNGWVVWAPALVKAGAILNRQDAEGQALLARCVDQRAVFPGRDPEPCVRDFREFASAVLGWRFSSKGYEGTEEAPVPADRPRSGQGRDARPRPAWRSGIAALRGAAALRLPLHATRTDRAWGAHGAMPAIPPDEDEVISLRAPSRASGNRDVGRTRGDLESRAEVRARCGR